MMRKNRLQHWCVVVVGMALATQAETIAGNLDLYVDVARGSDHGRGTKAEPFGTVSAAMARIPEIVEEDVTIHLAAGRYESAGRRGSHAQNLELNHGMCSKARVRIIGVTSNSAGPSPTGGVVFDWGGDSSSFLITVSQGHWTLENIQVGTRQAGQRCGINVTGPGRLEMRDVRIRTGSESGPGIRAEYGGRVELYGRIELNEDVREPSDRKASFCRIEAEYGGAVKFRQRKGATLVLGNGNLSASYYGIIELGCEQASITSWHYQANPIAVNNSGRVDLHNTTTRLCAVNPRNTPIGLEHDGHVLAEGAHIIIDGRNNSNAIVLQKASSLFCNDVEIRGMVKEPLLTMSGSTLLVGIRGDLGSTFATTGSCIIIEKCTGRLVGPLQTSKGGQIVKPEADTTTATAQPSAAHRAEESGGIGPVQAPDAAALPPLHRAAYGGHQQKVVELIEKGTDIHSKGPNGWTPLHLAAMGGHRALAEFLLSQGADLRARDNQGRTPTELAEKQGHTDLATFLREKSPGRNE